MNLYFQSKVGEGKEKRREWKQKENGEREGRRGKRGGKGETEKRSNKERIKERGGEMVEVEKRGEEGARN